MIDQIIEWGAWAIIVVGAVFSVVQRFIAPAMTETQLFLAAWPVWLMMILASAVLGYFQWSRS